MIYFVSLTFRSICCIQFRIAVNGFFLRLYRRVRQIRQLEDNKIKYTVQGGSNIIASRSFNFYQKCALLTCISNDDLSDFCLSFLGASGSKQGTSDPDDSLSHSEHCLKKLHRIIKKKEFIEKKVMILDMMKKRICTSQTVWFSWAYE